MFPAEGVSRKNFDKNCPTYPRIFDQLFAVVIVARAGRPLPVDLDAVDDALAVEAVDGGGQVGETRRAALEEAAEDGGPHGLAPEAGQQAGGRVLLAEVGEVGEST